MEIRWAGDRFRAAIEHTSGCNRTHFGLQSNTLRAAIEHTPTGMVLLDDEGSLVDLNERATRVLARPVDALLGHHLSDVVTDVISAVSIRADQQVTISSGTGTLLFETKTGERRRIGYTLREDVVPGLHLLGFETVE